MCTNYLKYSWFAASGTEAIEASIKIAKLYTGKSAFIVALKGFHGKTMGALSLMGKADYRAPMGALYAGQVYHVPFGDADAVEKQLEICEKVGIGVAAVMFEPIQGESGAIVPPDDFWPRIRAATKKYNVLLIADEVQTGLARTGKLWGSAFLVNELQPTPTRDEKMIAADAGRKYLRMSENKQTGSLGAKKKSRTSTEARPVVPLVWGD